MLEEEDKVPFTEHLDELRSRLIVCFVAVGIGFLTAYGFKELLFDILTAPLVEAMADSGSTMVFTGLPEAFFTYLKVALLAGFMLASPVVIYEFWMFVSPGLYKHERRVLIPIIFMSTVFFIGGASFGYFVVFPYGFQFFLGFANEHIKALPSMKEYLGLSAKLLLAFGLVFELPLVITFMAKLGLVTVPFLRKNRKYAILIFFIAAAIITPPDVVTQIMMAIPLMLLYELSIFGAIAFGRKPPEESLKSETPEGDAKS